MTDMLGVTLLAVLAVFVIFAFLVLRLDGVAFFAPKSTKRIVGSAQHYCTDQCRTVEGLCPLTGSAEKAENCPLWKFVDADMPTSLYGSPFEHVRSA